MLFAYLIYFAISYSYQENLDSKDYKTLLPQLYLI